MSALDLSSIRAMGEPLVTRFAPSPTGYLHLGHVANAVYVWGIARAVGARVLLRLEDHDRIRCRPVYEVALLEDLAWLGFAPDDPGQAPLRQRERTAIYEAVLERLSTAEQVYGCRCSRRDIGGGPYPGTCRQASVKPEASSARRVVIGPGVESFDDLLLGPQSQEPAAQCGDLLLRDRHGQWTYQFAVTVDDMLQGVNVVIRGGDLLDSTGRQLRLARMLGRARSPVFAHHPLILGPSGAKLSKSEGATGVRALRAGGMTPAQVIGLAAHLVGLVAGPTQIEAAAVGCFWDRI